MKTRSQTDDGLTKCGEEALTLVRFVLQNDGARTMALGLGLICHYFPPANHDAPTHYTVCYDTTLWKFGESVVVQKTGIIRISAKGLYGGDDLDMRPHDNLVSYLRSMLTPKNERADFYQRPRSVDIKSVEVYT